MSRSIPSRPALALKLAWLRYGPGSAAAVRAAHQQPVATTHDADDHEWLSAVAGAIRLAARWVPGSRCLDRSLALHHYAQARGVLAALKLGVRRLQDGQVTAHAWVTLAGEPIGEDPAALETLQPFDLERETVTFD